MLHSRSSSKDVLRKGSKESRRSASPSRRSSKGSKGTVSRKGSKEMVDGLKKSEKQALVEAVTTGIGVVGGDVFDQEKRERKVVNQLQESKRRMNASMDRLNYLMNPLGALHPSLRAASPNRDLQGRRHSKNGSMSVDPDENSKSNRMAKRLSVMQQENTGKTAGDIASRMCAESIEREQQEGTEVDTNAVSTISVRQLLRIDKRLSPEELRERASKEAARSRSKEVPDASTRSCSKEMPDDPSYVPPPVGHEDVPVRKRNVPTYRGSKEAAGPLR